MKKLNNVLKSIVLGIAIMFVISSFSVLSIKTTFNDQQFNDENIFTTDRGTHTVFAEYSTATWCGYCKYAHGALMNIYAENNYDFYYVSHVDDMNTKSDARNSEYNCAGFPTVFFDGGYQLQVGAGDVASAQANYENKISISETRSVPDIFTQLTVQWIGDATMNIAVSVQNNETSTYDGHIRVFVTEIESSMGWLDTWSNPYTFPLLEYAFNTDISVSPVGTWEDSITWIGANYNDGHGNDYSGITQDNIMVIAAVYNEEGIQTDAYPPEGYYFDAHYVDDATATIPMLSNPPDILNIATDPSLEEINGYINITCEITATFGLNDAKVNVLYPDLSSINQTMTNIVGTDSYYYNTSYSNPGFYDYYVWAKDTNNDATTSNVFTFEIGIPPDITLIDTSEIIQTQGGFVNVTCTVTDNELVNSVFINVTDPDDITNNHPMNQIGSKSDSYYYNSSYSLNGTYKYHIFADDNLGNIVISENNFYFIGEDAVPIYLKDVDAGWNMITVPIENSYNASSLAAVIEGCSIVSRFDAELQTYNSYIVGVSPPSADFTIVNGSSYFVVVDESSIYFASGDPIVSVSVPLYNNDSGWNMIGWYHDYDTTASNLGGSISDCTIVSMFNASLQTYSSFIVGVSPPSADFTINSGMGIFVSVADTSTWQGQG